jgi:hypothetical protein
MAAGGNRLVGDGDLLEALDRRGASIHGRQ